MYPKNLCMKTEKKLMRILKLFIFSALVISMAVCSVCTTEVSASSDIYNQSAVKLGDLGLFKGTDNGFELYRRPTRAEAACMLVRFLGKESDALKETYNIPFKDVPDWAVQYVGYLYSNNMAKGLSDNYFGANEFIDMDAYTTFVLRALKYNDSEPNLDFTWETAKKKAVDISLLSNADLRKLSKADFTRGKMVYLSERALNTNIKGRRIMLRRLLASQGIISVDPEWSTDKPEWFDSIIAAGEKHLGVPYLFGSANPEKGFDCSGFVSYVYNNSNLGFKLPRSSQSIFNNIKTFELEQDARPGDLIFFTGTYNSKNPVTHVGIYIGDGRMLHAGSKAGISYQNLNIDYYKKHFYGFGRVEPNRSAK